MSDASGMGRIRATRLVSAIRSGGSVPCLMEADDLGTYVVKLRGAGQGVAALIADVVGAELARLLGLPTPRLAVVEVDTRVAGQEPDAEVRDVVQASVGTNLGVDFLPGARDFVPGTSPVDPTLAGEILWFDALIANTDRSSDNPNLMSWHRRLYLIDHGAALTFHHAWHSASAWVDRPYDVSRHVLATYPADLRAADERMAVLVSDETLRSVTATIPEPWLREAWPDTSPDRIREAYRTLLGERLARRDNWGLDFHSRA